jgi:immunoglobulin heavy chain
VRLSCAGSGFNFTNYYMGCICQTPEKGLEWVTCIKHKLDGYETEKIASVKSRFAISRDYSNTNIYLQINSPRNEDMSMYVCKTHIGKTSL